MMSLKEARAEVLENKKELDKGRDPLQLKLKRDSIFSTTNRSANMSRILRDRSRT